MPFYGFMEDTKLSNDKDNDEVVVELPVSESNERSSEWRASVNRALNILYPCSEEIDLYDDEQMAKCATAEVARTNELCEAAGCTKLEFSVDATVEDIDQLLKDKGFL